MTISATVICDASYHGVTGRTPVHAGWAAWVRIDGVNEPVRGYGSLPPGLCLSASDAEMYAAINGLWLAAKHGAGKVLVRSDCMTVVQAIQGTLKNERLKTLWVEGLDKCKLQGVVIRARHVKGHGTVQCAATYVNDWCDKHAKLSQRKARGGSPCQKIL